MVQAQNDLMLVAMVPEALKDNLVDSLMLASFLTGFSLSKVQGFSQKHSHFNLAEQVEGYREFYRFEIIHKAAHTTSVLNLLRTKNESMTVRYWLIPVLETGAV